MDAVLTIVIPARNAAPTIGAALASVLQCPRLAEAIVVNDASTDATVEAVQAIGDDRVRIVDGPGQGIAAALNAGFAAVRTPYVMRCDADDFLLPQPVPDMLAFLEAHPDHVAISGGYETALPDGTRVTAIRGPKVPTDMTERLRSGQTAAHFCAWIVRTAALHRIGGARDWFVTAEDVDLQMRLGAIGRVRMIPDPVYRYRLHDASITHRQTQARNDFYDTAARGFARQRRETGTDDLARGNPPVFTPSAGAPDRPARRAVHHAAGHLQGAAWDNVAAGHYRAARTDILRALRLHPGSLMLWRSAAKIAALAAIRRDATTGGD